MVLQMYHQFKACGKQSIKEPEVFFGKSHFFSDVLDLMIDVYHKYGRYTDWTLKEMTHKLSDEPRCKRHPALFLSETDFVGSVTQNDIT